MANKLDLASFEKKVRVRRLRARDYDSVVALQLACFPSMKPWSREQFESQLTTFPEGQLGVTVNQALVASSSSLIVDFDMYSEWHDWMKLSDSGFIRNHDPKGRILSRLTL